MTSGRPRQSLLSGSGPHFANFALTNPVDNVGALGRALLKPLPAVSQILQWLQYVRGQLGFKPKVLERGEDMINGVDWSPFLRQTVRTHFSSNGELGH